MARGERVRLWLTGAALACLAAGPAGAQPRPAGEPGQTGPTLAQPETSDQPSDEVNGPSPGSIQTSLGPYGDPGGYRAFLEKRGIAYSLTYIGEVLGNPSGGTRRGAIYEGRLDIQLDAKLDTLMGWQGALLHANIYQIHGRGLSRDDLGNLSTASGIEALPSSRLYELWLEQKLLDGKVAIRAGQLAADTEFFVSQTAGLFVNATFGWPTITGANLPSGGPAYPLATPGARLMLQPNPDLALLLGVFDGDPSGPRRSLDPADPQIRNRSGLEFRTKDPPLLIAEGAYTYSIGPRETGLPGTVKLGYWHHFGRFDDQRFGDDGLPLADPLSGGIARRFRGNDGVYGVIDQSLYRVPGSRDSGVAGFLRVSASPDDRNLVGFYLDAGLSAKGVIPGRDDDTFGLGFALTTISDRARGLDRDARSLAILSGGGSLPVRSDERLLEASYQAQVVPGFTVQPDIQYVFRPGAGAADPRDPSARPIKDAAVFGLRATVRY